VLAPHVNGALQAVDQKPMAEETGMARLAFAAPLGRLGL
jgi:hypothetical protein